MKLIDHGPVGMKRVTGPDVAAMSPEEWWFSFSDIMRMFDLSADQLTEEGRSGRLRAKGMEKDGKIVNVGIRGDDLIQWIAATGRVEQFERMIKSNRSTHVQQ